MQPVAHWDPFRFANCSQEGQRFPTHSQYKSYRSYKSYPPFPFAAFNPSTCGRFKNGYAWYHERPAVLLAKDFPAWKKKVQS
jgi:hypothetical protein